jgi:hypothetical protein
MINSLMELVVEFIIISLIKYEYMKSYYIKKSRFENNSI